MALKTETRPIVAGALALVCLGAAPGGSAPGGSLAAEAACRPEARYALSYDGGLMSLTSEQACLETILQALQRQAPVTIHLPPAVSQEPVNVSFSGLPLDDALGRLLSRTSYLILTRPPNDDDDAERTAGAAGPLEVWVVGRGTPSPAAPDREASRAELLDRARAILAADTGELMAQALEAPSPRQRADAVALLVHAEKDAAVAETVLAALEDPDPQVRAAALHVVADLGAEAPGAAAAVAHMARRDESPDLRMRALEKLFAANYRRDLARDTVLAALDDPQVEVRSLAHNLLELVSPHEQGD